MNSPFPLIIGTHTELLEDKNSSVVKLLTIKSSLQPSIAQNPSNSVQSIIILEKNDLNLGNRNKTKFGETEDFLNEEKLEMLPEKTSSIFPLIPHNIDPTFPYFDLKKFAHKLVIIGDSLFDTGNLTNLLAPLGIIPFPVVEEGVFYSEGKVSNGLVLGETIAQGLGISPESILPRSESPYVNLFTDNVNYAIASATTGVISSVGGDGSKIDLPIGLLSQVEQFKRDIEPFGQTLFYKKFLKKRIFHNDGIVSIGSNDVLQTLALQEFTGVLATINDNTDDLVFIQNIATEIVGNIDTAIDTLDDYLHEIVILGLSRLGNTPFAIQIDQQIAGNLSNVLSEGEPDLASSLFTILSGQTRDLLTGIAQEVNEQLVELFDDELNNNENVLVIDGFAVQENAVEAWQDSLGGLGITDLSYSDYFSGVTNLPDGLSVDNFFSIDGVHPTSNANEFIANEIVPSILAEFPHFTFA